jgi:hypothetical protein
MHGGGVGQQVFGQRALGGAAESSWQQHPAENPHDSWSIRTSRLNAV